MNAALLATSAFYLDPFRPLIMAMVRAEGGELAFVKAVQCSRPEVKDLGVALAIACKTIRNRVIEYQSRGLGPLLVVMNHDRDDPWTGEPRPRALVVSPQFIAFLGARWAPPGVTNDPTHLNENWAGNVTKIYAQLCEDEGKGVMV